MRAFLRVRDREQGAAMVEFAIVLPVLFVLAFGIMDLARAVWQANTLAYAAREGTRYAIVHGSGGSPTVWPGGNQGLVTDVVQRAAVGVPNVTVTVSWPDMTPYPNCYDRNCRVQVDATAPFTPLPSEIFLGSTFKITLRGGSVLVIQR